jgi:hypothetical protein
MLRAMLCALALSACATPHNSSSSKSRVYQERTEDAVKRMQDEFNTLTRDAS